MSESKNMVRYRGWIGCASVIVLLVACALVYNYFDYKSGNLHCLNDTDAIDVDHGFVMGNTSCHLAGESISVGSLTTRGEYYFACREGNFAVTADTSRANPLACSISGIRIGALPENIDPNVFGSK